MKMLARIRYLIDEGFEVSSISGYDDDSGNGNAQLMYVENCERRRCAAFVPKFSM